MVRQEVHKHLWLFLIRFHHKFSDCSTEVEDAETVLSSFSESRRS